MRVKVIPFIENQIETTISEIKSRINSQVYDRSTLFNLIDDAVNSLIILRDVIKVEVPVNNSEVRSTRSPGASKSDDVHFTLHVDKDNTVTFVSGNSNSDKQSDNKKFVDNENPIENTQPRVHGNTTKSIPHHVRQKMSKSHRKNCPFILKQYTLNGVLVATYDDGYQYAAAKNGISPGVICNACTGWADTAGGYIWKRELKPGRQFRTHNKRT